MTLLLSLFLFLLFLLLRLHFVMYSILCVHVVVFRRAGELHMPVCGEIYGESASNVLKTSQFRSLQFKSDNLPHYTKVSNRLH
jgi:hypothetical protein